MTRTALDRASKADSLLSWRNEITKTMDESKQREADATSELNDVAAEIGQTAVSVITSQEILEHVPVLKVGLAVWKMVGSVRDRLLMNKLEIFLRGFSHVAVEERRLMVQRLQDDPVFHEDVGEHLIELLDRVDGRRKPAIIASAFAAFAEHKIELKMLRRLCSAVERLPIYEINMVRVLREYNSTKNEIAKEPPILPDRTSLLALVNAGLAESESFASGIGYELSDTGKAFLDLDLDR